MARCKVYEIQGSDASRTASAVRCHRDAVKKVKVDGKEYPICKKHRGVRWHLFTKDGWAYAVDLEADHP
jgi:hypothetical protein